MQINLVLSGGGARGLAHLGIIKALQEFGISIKGISGTSFGAVAGAFIATGLKPDEVLEIFNENNLLFHIRPAFNDGLFRMNKWEEMLMTYFPKNSFADLKIPLTVNSTDINEGKCIYFSEGELVKPVLASASIPGIFEPIIINQRQYVDGGVLDNLPVIPFLNDPTVLFTSHVNPVNFEADINSMFKIVERSFLISIMEKVIKVKALSHFFFEPPELQKFSMFDFDHAGEIFKIGYQTAVNQRKKIERIIGL